MTSGWDPAPKKVEWPNRKIRHGRGGGKSALEDRLARWMAREDLPRPHTQFQFAKETLGRKWAFDFAWPDRGIALEVEGGEFVGGRHQRGGEMTKDAEKYNAAALLGWRVFRVTTTMMKTGEAFTLAKSMLTTEITYRPTVLAITPPVLL